MFPLSETDKLSGVFPIHGQVGQQPSWKICLRIKLSFGFWGRAVKAYDNFPES